MSQEHMKVVFRGVIDIPIETCECIVSRACTYFDAESSVMAQLGHSDWGKFNES